GTGGLTLPELTGNLREVHVSIKPQNDSATGGKVIPSIVHFPHKQQLPLSGGAATVYVPDYQDFCTCSDSTGPAVFLCQVGSCTQNAPGSLSMLSGNYPSIQGSCNVTGNTTHTVNVVCW